MNNKTFRIASAPLRALLRLVGRARREVRGRLAVQEARRLGVAVGERCRFIGTSAATFSTEPWLIEIGHHVSITNAQFITHDGAVWVFREQHPNIELFGRIVIEDNVFIGHGAIILPGTRIRANSVVAAGAVVKGQHPEGSILAGVPARHVASIGEYYEKNAARFTHLRSLPAGEKRRRVIAALSERA